MPKTKIALIEADCLEAMKAIPSGSINLVLCDLPYGTTQNKWDSVIPLDALWREYQRILAPRGAIVLTGQGSFTARLICSQEDWFRYKVTWVKSKATNFLNAKKQPLRKHEDICVFYPEQPTYRPQMGEGAAYDKGVRKNQLTGSYGDFDPVHVKSEGGRYPTDVVYFKTAESEGEVFHPTQKPVELGRYLIRTYTNPGDVVLDNAFGSGSFLVAAAAEGRSAIGIELNADITAFKKDAMDLIAVAAQRLAPYELVALKTRRNVPTMPTSETVNWLFDRYIGPNGMATNIERAEEPLSGFNLVAPARPVCRVSRCDVGVVVRPERRRTNAQQTNPLDATSYPASHPTR